MNYNDLNDYELVSYVAEGNEDANAIIMEKYQPVITKFAKKMMDNTINTGLEISDLEQEGRLGLIHAIDTFCEQKDAAFYTYAKTCIERSIISAVIRSKRLKHKFLNESLSYDSEEIDVNKLLKDNVLNPENIILSSESEEKIIKKMKNKLTDLEQEVFQLLIAGFSYKEISVILDKDIKAVDNTIQRVRRKLKEYLMEES